MGADISFFRSNEFTQLKDALDYAYGKGCVLVAAALNDDTSEPYYPGAWENVICVGAIDHNNSRMEYQYPNNGQVVISNYGDWVDVAAPGEEIFTTSPMYDCILTNLGREKGYTLMSGTSLATPFVAGLAALLLSDNPSFSPDEVMKIIRANVDPYDSEEYIGTGRVNAYKALTRSNGQPDVPVTPTGNLEGRTGRQYIYSSSASDPDGDQLYYVWDWGDGNYSETLGPFESGEACEADYAWGHDGNYSVRVKAMDMEGGESYWSDPAIVSMPKNRILNPMFLRFLERYPNLFPILKVLLGID